MLCDSWPIEVALTELGARRVENLRQANPGLAVVAHC